MGLSYPTLWVCSYCDSSNIREIRSCRVLCSGCHQRSVFYSNKCGKCWMRVECLTIPPAKPYECVKGYRAGNWDECMEKLNETVGQVPRDGGLY